MKTNWPVGTIVRARCVIIDGDLRSDHLPWITARPGDLGIVREHCGSDTTHEIVFPNGCFTSAPDDPAIELYDGPVSVVCDGTGLGHLSQINAYLHMAGRPPVTHLCASPNHPEGAPDRDLWNCGLCGRAKCASCEGAADDLHDLCDECWAKSTRDH